MLEIARRAPGSKGLTVSSRRGGVERAFAGRGRCRRLAEDFKRNHRKRGRLDSAGRDPGSCFAASLVRQTLELAEKTYRFCTALGSHHSSARQTRHYAAVAASRQGECPLMPTDVKYPYAFNAQGEIVPAKGAPRTTYTCPGCGQRMDVVHPKKNVDHYRHRTRQDAQSCDPEATLHNMGQAILVQRLSEGRTYRFTKQCEDCCCVLHTEITPVRATAEDRDLVPNARPDVVVFDETGQPHILEVVVTHGLEAATKALYTKSGHPVWSITLKDPEELPKHFQETEPARPPP